MMAGMIISAVFLRQSVTEAHAAVEMPRGWSRRGKRREELAALQPPCDAEMIGRRGAPPRSTQKRSKWTARVSASRFDNVPEALSHPSPTPPGSLCPTLLRATYCQLTKHNAIGIEWLTLKNIVSML